MKFEGGLEIKKLDTVEAIEAEIKLLQKKLEFYKELENQPKTLFDVIRNLGYSVDACYEIVDAIEEFEKQKEREMIKRNLKTSLQEMVNGDVRPIDDVIKEAKEEYPYKKYTPEETEKSLREAFRTAIKEGIIPEIKQPTDELIDKLVKNPPEFLKFELGKSLTDIIYRWWDDVFTTHSDWDMETSIEDLVDQIQMWLPKEQSAAGSQNIGVEELVTGWNDCLNKIKGKLR